MGGVGSTALQQSTKTKTETKVSLMGYSINVQI